jgi:hypothetical protein
MLSVLGISERFWKVLVSTLGASIAHIDRSSMKATLMVIPVDNTPKASSKVPTDLTAPRSGIS